MMETPDRFLRHGWDPKLLKRDYPLENTMINSSAIELFLLERTGYTRKLTDYSSSADGPSTLSSYVNTSSIPTPKTWAIR